MKTYKCIYCKYTVMTEKNKKDVITAKHKMGKHYEDKHKDMLPDGMSGYRWFYYTLTKKDKGSCVICKNETDFNEITMKYARFCNNPQCKQKYKEERDKRMIEKYGKVHLLDDPEQQKKMLENRRIAGTYNWSDGKTKIQYVSTYECDFLRHLDQDLHWPAADIIMPSPHTYSYDYDGKSHYYIPDAFIPSLSLEIEIKSKQRMDKQNPVSREKEVLKDELMKSLSNIINYIIIFDKDYTEFNKIIQKDDQNT